MSNLDVAPAESTCHRTEGRGPVAILLEARQVPLGGLRGLTVTRTLPQRALPMVGAWTFFDQVGPERADMRLLPHPHIGLQTVTWPLLGEVRHRDSLGSDTRIRPGELNLMTSGRGISHSEFSLGELPMIRALQLWVALPADRAQGEPAFEQHRNLPLATGDGWRATVFIGELAGPTSPATVYSPLVGAEISVDPGPTDAEIPSLRTDFEYAVMVLDGSATIAGVELTAGPLLYLGQGRSDLAVTSPAGARLLILGGAPFEEELLMWWNFVGRSHEEIAQARDDWQSHDNRFGIVEGHGAQRIPAPPLPDLRLTPRRRGLR